MTRLAQRRQGRARGRLSVRLEKAQAKGRVAQTVFGVNVGAKTIPRFSKEIFAKVGDSLL